MKTQRSKTGIVHKMREIRDKVSFDIMEMSLDEEKNFIKKQLSELKRKRKYVVQQILLSAQMQNRLKKKDRVFGYAKGKITLKPDFDDPVEDFKEYM